MNSFARSMGCVSLATLFLCCIAFDATGNTPDAADDKVSDRPNVVLIMTDDQGCGDFGFAGNPVIKTPNLDELASRSAQLGTFYVSPVCAPTRASLMTGRYNYRTRAIDTWIGRAMMEPDEVTVAEVLRDAGYATAIFGKWHLGDCYPMRAMDQGFETALVHRGGGIGQPSDPSGAEGKYADPILFRNGTAEQMKGYCTDVYFNEAASWINRVHDNGPFFAYIATNAPHGPFHDVPTTLYEMYREMDLGNGRFPQDVGHALPKSADTDRRARIFAMISNIDENVGRLLERLQELGEVENTLLIFLVDNGPNGRRYVAGMRGSKGTVYEGGTRSPFLAHWPAQLNAKTVASEVTAHIDVMPTILDACDVPVPDGLKLDGRSALPLLQGREPDWPDRPVVLQWHRGDEPAPYQHFALRTNRWKLIGATSANLEARSEEPPLELYDMFADPYEERDVATDDPEVVAELRALYDTWFADVSGTRPDNYDPPRIHIGSKYENPTVLTRQDWRHDVGRGWGQDSQGHWVVHIERAGKYDVTCRFKSFDESATVQLTIGDDTWTQSIDAGTTTCDFKIIALEPGDVSIAATVENKETSQIRGVHQADVHYR